MLLHECRASRESMQSLGNRPLALHQLTVSIKQGQKAGSTSKIWGVATSTGSPGGTDGVAALLRETRRTGVCETVIGLSGVHGKVYATMPLPLNVSGLPVHVNGAFWMQADRRKLWSGEGDRGKVNQCCM